MLLNRWLVIVALGVVLNVTVSGVKLAWGYLPPAHQIIQFVAQKTAMVYNFRLDVLAEIPDPDHPGVMISRQMVYHANRPDYLRQEVVDETKSGTILIGSGRRLSVVDGHFLVEKPRHEEIFPSLLFANSAETIKRLLVGEQVDIGEVHLGRMGGQIAYVIGGQPREPDAPQFWCDKDHFWPLRLVGRRSRQGVADLVDIRLLSYQEVANDIWMPSVIEFYRQRQLFLRLVVQKTYHNRRLEERLFDLGAFMTGHKQMILPK